MLYTDTDSFVYLFVKDLSKEINARPQLRDLIFFNNISMTNFLNLNLCIAYLNS